ncbi:hypothetical protein, partial [Rubrivivax albus]|uniref:hypothetical protein n=1 Tax=Rubrivivax albus TaxID=2499835 RepID=UPI0018EEA799
GLPARPPLVIIGRTGKPPCRSPRLSSNVMRHQDTRPAGKALQIVERYAEAFRALVNARVWRSDESPTKALRLNSEDDWSFICVAMDVVGDASYALDNFLRFGLNGPTKYDNTGEKYLRLYGMLSAVYLQQEAVRKLYALMNCPSPRTVDREFASLEVRILRHQVASHSVDYKEPGTNKLVAYVPVRIGLDDYSCMVTAGRGDSTRTIDLEEAVRAHCDVTHSVLDRIYEKSIRTFFKGQVKKIAEFKAALDDLRKERDGELILLRAKTPGGTDIRIKLVGAERGLHPEDKI